jgi:hypothetical protein
VLSTCFLFYFCDDDYTNSKETQNEEHFKQLRELATDPGIVININNIFLVCLAAENVFHY